jgi:hypothetical protein
MAIKSQNTKNILESVVDMVGVNKKSRKGKKRLSATCDEYEWEESDNVRMVMSRQDTKLSQKTKVELWVDKNQILNRGPQNPSLSQVEEISPDKNKSAVQPLAIKIQDNNNTSVHQCEMMLEKEISTPDIIHESNPAIGKTEMMRVNIFLEKPKTSKELFRVSTNRMSPTKRQGCPVASGPDILGAQAYSQSQTQPVASPTRTVSVQEALKNFTSGLHTAPVKLKEIDLVNYKYAAMDNQSRMRKGFQGGKLKKDVKPSSGVLGYINKNNVPKDSGKLTKNMSVANIQRSRQTVEVPKFAPNMTHNSGKFFDKSKLGDSMMNLNKPDDYFSAENDFSEGGPLRIADINSGRQSCYEDVPLDINLYNNLNSYIGANDKTDFLRAYVKFGDLNAITDMFEEQKSRFEKIEYSFLSALSEFLKNQQVQIDILESKQEEYQNLNNTVFK